MAPSTVAVGLFGVGLIGKAFMRQLAQQAEFLQEQLNVQPLVVAVANSRRMVLSAGGLQHTDWQAALTTEVGSRTACVCVCVCCHQQRSRQLARTPWALPWLNHASADCVPPWQPPPRAPPWTAQGGGSQAADPDALARHVAAHAGAAAGVVLDCTASAALPAHYARWVSQHGLSIVTPNKQLGAGPWARYAELRSALRGAAPAGAHFMYEATVGAGLPVISTLRGLLETGDRVARVEGVLSGTLSYLFNGLAPGVAFSGVVGAARALGYTEPDPREDLSGAWRDARTRGSWLRAGRGAPLPPRATTPRRRCWRRRPTPRVWWLRAALQVRMLRARWSSWRASAGCSWRAQTSWPCPASCRARSRTSA
jgi:aspartokinase/homoserine dehydrogenase 1